MPEVGRVYVHKKTGGHYYVIGLGKMQSREWWYVDKFGDRYEIDMTTVVIYQGKDTKMWVRPIDEFEDRFELFTG